VIAVWHVSFTVSDPDAANQGAAHLAFAVADQAPVRVAA
jgi:hypothetical protein